MRCFVTGGAGFVGSTLVDRLIANGEYVVAYDNLSTGRITFIERAKTSKLFEYVHGSTLHVDSLRRAMAGCDVVFHLAANADVRFGTTNPGKDLEQNTIATFNVLEAMRSNGIQRIAFASTGSVYGEPSVFPTPETAPFPIQTSLYGASKLAAEGLIEAYCEGFGFQAYIFRFVSLLGERYTHGHVFDFCKQLLIHPDHLDVLGNGRQRKSYLYIQDCISAILLAMARTEHAINIFNLGTDDYCEVNDSIGWICGRLDVSPTRHYSGGTRGWVGDSPFIFLDCSRIRALGWAPHLTIREAVLRTVDYLRATPSILEQDS